jgi:hypothetical protein
VAANPDFPLQIGIVTHAITYDAQPPPEVNAYTTRPGTYDVVFMSHDSGETLGPAQVSQINDQTFRVRPLFRLAFPAENCAFWGAFVADEGGLATLDAVYLIVTEPV